MKKVLIGVAALAGACVVGELAGYGMPFVIK